MVIFYDLTTKDILYTEQERITPELPKGTVEEKVNLLKEENKGFVSVPYEAGMEILDYKVCLDSNNNFIGLQPKDIMYLS